MKKQRGLFIVFEGIDGAGTSTQLPNLTKWIKEQNKHHDILETHEPWNSQEINEKLAKDRDAFSEGEQMAELYVQDRMSHTHNLIQPTRDGGAFVICDRYTMSTCAYQMTQGVPLTNLIHMQQRRGILVPDITFYLHVHEETATQRLTARGDPVEKFEGNKEFRERLIHAYRGLANIANVDPSFFGRVEFINGNQSKEEVAKEIQERFRPLYESWAAGTYQGPNPEFA